jgi:hypothetical protein
MSNIYLIAPKPKSIVVSLDQSGSVVVYEDSTGQGGANWKVILNASNYPASALPLEQTEKFNYITTNQTITTTIKSTDYLGMAPTDPDNPWPIPPPPPPNRTISGSVITHMYLRQHQPIVLSQADYGEVEVFHRKLGDGDNDWVRAYKTTYNKGTPIDLQNLNEEIYIFAQIADITAELRYAKTFHYLRSGDPGKAPWPPSPNPPK